MFSPVALARRLETVPTPVITDYGPDGRVELSGRTAANWVAKTASHLSDEVAAAPGDVLLLDLPAHWRTVALALGAWAAGLHVVVPAADADPADLAAGADVVATTRPEAWSSAPEVLAVDLSALSLRWPGEMPLLVRDWASEVRGGSDRLPGSDAAAPDSPALTVPLGAGAVTRTMADLARGGPDAPRRVLTDGDPTRIDRWLVPVLAAGGSIVLARRPLSAAEMVTERVEPLVG